jgi:serine/threonine protein kinase
MSGLRQDDALLGRVIDGRYRVDARLGAGGMGVLYRARQLKVDRDVALKLLRRERRGDEGAVARFLDEAKVISKLRSPHTVTLIDVGELEDGDVYIAMELLEGQTLRARLQDGPLSFEDTLRIIDPVALSLSEAHARGVVHRDLKPANVFLARTAGHSAFAKVLDFGLAVLAGTKSSGFAGTPRYVAPELVTGGQPTPGADVYALGILLTEMLTGRSPYEAEGTEAMLRAHVEQEPLSLAELAPDVVVPEPVQTLISRCLAKHPRLRPKDAATFRRALRDAAGLVSIDEESSTASTDGPGEAGPRSIDTKATLPSILSLSRLERPSRALLSRRRLALAALALAASGMIAWRLAPSPPAPTAPATVAPPSAAATPSAAPDTPPEASGNVEPESDKPDMVSVLVHTIPDGATVLVDGKRRGETPVTLYLAKGASTSLTLQRRGYRDQILPVTPTEDGKLRRVLAPVAAAAPKGSAVPKASAAPKGVSEKMERYLD